MEIIRFITLFFSLVTSVLSHATEVIAHPSVYSKSLSIISARNIFSMRTQSWPDGIPIKVFVLSDDSELHKNFSKQILQVFPYKLRRIWDRNIYSGTGEAPIIVNTEEDMLKAISTTAGAIGYANKGNDNVRIIKIH